MKEFSDQDFLLRSPTAKELYRIAESLPIVDYHCHISPKEIWEDKRFENLTQIWLAHDHYKWRLMRADGIDEHYITGSAPDKEKFLKFAQTLPKAIGNPMYHWCHLELKRYFGYDGILNRNTAEEVWHLTEEKLNKPEFSARGILKQSNVVFLGTTDDPADSLEWHEKLKKDPSFSPTVAPTFRPDKGLNCEKEDFADYIKTLSAAAGEEICDLASLKGALCRRMDRFSALGCRAADHGLDYAFFREGTEEESDEILKKALSGKSVSPEEAERYKTNLILFCGREYHRRGWVMQIHYNCIRNPNTKAFRTQGPDSGFDILRPHNSEALVRLLDTLNTEKALPKTVLYSLDGNDNGFLDCLTGAFQGPEIPGKLQHGSAWWFNDHKKGMEEQLTSLANLGVLGNFIGMLTDSRSFLSYSRHEYFRRILCNLLGKWVEEGEYPYDENTLTQLVTGICYGNAVTYFNLEETP